MDNKLLLILLGAILLSIVFFFIKSKVESKKRAILIAEEKRQEELQQRRQEKEESQYKANFNKGVPSAKKSPIMRRKENDTRKKPSSWTSAASYEEDISKTNFVQSEQENNTLPDNQELKMKILLVDDSLVVRKYVGTLLTKNEYDVIVKNDGQEALDFLQNNPKPDLLISDIEMPNLDGIELISKLREDETFSELPILVISAHAEKHLQLMESESIQGFIKKPFKDEDLLMQIEYVLENMS